MSVTLKDNQGEWKILLNSEAGAKLVQWLQETYDGHKLFNKDNAHDTAYRLGQRDVVKFLEDVKNG